MRGFLRGVALLLAMSPVAIAQLPDGPERTEALQKRKELQQRIDVYLSQRKYVAAVVSLEAALELDRKIHGPTSKPVYFTLAELADQYFTVDQFASAVKIFEAMEPLALKHFGEKHWRTKTLRLQAQRAVVLSKLEKSDQRWEDIRKNENRGYLALSQGKPDEALESWTEAVLLTEKVFGKKSYHYVSNLQVLGLVCFRANKYKRAIETFEELVTLDVELYGEIHPDTAMNISFLGAAYRNHGQTVKAEPHILKSVASARQLLEEGGLSPQQFLGMLRGASSFYIEQDDVERMRPFTTEARTFAEKQFGKVSPQYSTTLLDAILLHTKAGEFDKATLFVEEAFEVMPKVYKAPHEELAKLHHRAAVLLKYQELPDDAYRHLERAIKLYRELPNRNPNALYECRNDLGLIFLKLSRLDDAVAIFSELVKESKQSYGEQSLRHAAANHNLALAYRDSGSFEFAEKYYRQALAIKESIEKDSLDCAISLEGLGGLYLGVQDFAAAELFLLQASAIREKRLGPRHPLVGSTFNELGVLNLDRGDYRKAEYYLAKAVGIYKGTSPNHPMIPKSMDNLAKLARAIGDDVKALELLVDALHIRRNILAKDAYDLAVGLNNLAVAFHVLNKLDRAEPLYREALGIFEKQKTIPKSDVAVISHNLGKTLQGLNRRDESLAAYDYALKTWGEFDVANPRRKNHPQKIDLLLSMAVVRIQQNKPQEAEAFSSEAVKIARHVFDRESSTLEFTLTMHGMVLAGCEKPDAANAAMRDALIVQDRLLNDVLGFTSEKDMLAYAWHGQNNFHRIVKAAAENPSDTKTVALAWEMCQRRKGIILDRLCRYREWERSLSKDDAMLAQVRAFRALKKRISEAMLNPGPTDTPDSIRKLQNEADELQAKINRRISEVMPLKEPRFDTNAVRDHLPAKGCLVEFVRASTFDYVLGDKSTRDTENYIAFVLPADPKQPMQVFDLGDAGKIDRAVKLLRDNLAEFPPEQEARYERQYKSSAAALYGLIIKPLLPAMAGAKSLLVIPDGALNRVPFSALVDAEKKYLVESLTISVLPSRRDLFRQAPKEWASGVALFANPDYNADFSSTNKSTAIPSGNTLPALSGKSWKELPETAAEARALEQVLANAGFGTVKTFEGKAARTEVVETLPPVRILHFATHGTYVEMIPNQQESDLRSPGSRQSSVTNPMLRSAIILAGANRPPRSGGQGSSIDGLLTAEEVSMLNMQGTELVVLSACESGLGEVKASEGVFGLHRAFIHAGAHSLIVTLYEVPDIETGKVMKRFYENLAAKQSKSDALAAAQRSYLKERRGEKGENPAHPLFWAAFVLYSDGR